MSKEDIIVPIDDNFRIRIEETAARTTMHFEIYEKDRWTKAGELWFISMEGVAFWLPYIARALNRLEKLMLLK